MLSKKLMTLLQTLSKHELNQFRKFVYSPYYNENQEIIQLFDLINKTIKDNSSNLNPFLLEKKQVWKKIYRQVPYEDTKMRRLCSDLTKLAEKFLTCQYLSNNSIQEMSLTLQAVNHPMLENHFNNLVRSIKHEHNKKGFKNATFHYNQYLIEHQQHVRSEKSGIKFSSLKNLKNADYHFNCHFFINKLKYYCDMLDYTKSNANKATIELFPYLLDYLSTSSYLEEVAVKSYYYVTLMLLTPQKEDYFKKLKLFLNIHHDKFPLSELKSLYTYLLNYCIDTKINVGKSEYFYELFDIYKTLITKKIIFDNNILTPQDYKNIITVGLHVQAFEWVENFIQTYTPKLPQDHQENALNYNLAKVYFHQKQYEKVIDQLREVEYKSLIYALGGKLMLLKTYYELKEVRALDSLIESFRIYLRRNRLISRDVQQQYLNVLRFVKKMANVAPYDKKAVAKIREQIDNCKALADKKWILEKVNEF